MDLATGKGTSVVEVFFSCAIFRSFSLSFSLSDLDDDGRLEAAPGAAEIQKTSNFD